MAAAPAPALAMALPADHMNYSQNPNEILCLCVCVPAQNEVGRDDKTVTVFVFQAAAFEREPAPPAASD